MTKIVTTTHNCHCEVTSSKISAKFTNMRLHGGIRVKVDQHMKIRLPLSTDCECHEVGQDSDCGHEQQQTQINQGISQIPMKETHVTVQSPPKPAPKPSPKPISNPPSARSSVRSSTSSGDKKITVFLNARDLPKMDNFLEGSSCDPYYIFSLDQGSGYKKISGGPHLAIKNQRKGAWSFVIAEKEIAGSKKMKIELWDVDSGSKDDFIGDFECSSGAFLSTGGFKNAKLLGKAAKK